MIAESERRGAAPTRAFGPIHYAGNISTFREGFCGKMVARDGEIIYLYTLRMDFAGPAQGLRWPYAGILVDSLRWVPPHGPALKFSRSSDG